MKKFWSPSYSDAAHNWAMLLLRLALGFNILIGHGWEKIENFNALKDNFVNFLGLGPQVSLVLSIFAEFVCAALIILGLFTRGAAALLVINMLTALTLVHHWEIISDGPLPFVFLAGWVTILLLGPGKHSLDNIIWKKKTPRVYS